MNAEPTSAYIDNNVWDYLHNTDIDLARELPREEFCCCITREAEFEISPIPDSKADLKSFIQETIDRCCMSTDTFFGFYDDSLPPDQQRVGGFDVGRWAQPADLAFLAQQRTSLRSRLMKTGLYRNEADISLGARAFTGIVLSLDKKVEPINRAYKQCGRVVFFTDFDKSELGPADFIRAAAKNDVNS